jgi:tetratricopeptide (TPR) repeat protein
MRAKSILWLALFVLALVPAVLRAQEATGKIHGHAQDPGGVAMTNASVQLSLDGKTPKYTFTADQNGDYKGDGIAPGTYVVTLFQGTDKAVDRFENVKITAGTDTLQDFDLSRADYLNKLSPEERKAIEDAKAKNAGIMKDNEVIKKLNTMLQQARDDDKAKKYDDAASLMQQATQAKPDSSILWLELGTAQVGQKKFDDAITSLKKAIDVDTASKKPSPEIQAAANNGLGEAYASSNKIPDATAAYDSAAKLLPANAGMYYTNETIVLSRTTQTDATVAAADKAIAADPNKAIPYYLKGQALISKATVDPKTQQIVAPPGTAEAYEKYIDLDPNGPFVQPAEQVLAEIGQKVNSKYTAKKK